MPRIERGEREPGAERQLRVHHGGLVVGRVRRICEFAQDLPAESRAVERRVGHRRVDALQPVVVQGRKGTEGVAKRSVHHWSRPELEGVR